MERYYLTLAWYGKARLHAGQEKPTGPSSRDAGTERAKNLD